MAAALQNGTDAGDTVAEDRIERAEVIEAQLEPARKVLDVDVETTVPSRPRCDAAS